MLISGTIITCNNLSLFQVGRMEGPRLLEEGRLLQHVHAAEANQRLLRFGVEYSTYDVHNSFSSMHFTVSFFKN